MDTFCYFLGATAAVFLLVAAVRVVALRVYGSLLDGGAPREAWDGGVRGVYSGRVAELGFVSSGYKDRPSLLQISIACAAPVRVEANRRSLAFMVRKLVGVQADRKTGIEELDRLFAFFFDERAKLDACVSKHEVRESFASLADLGVESLRLSEGMLTVRAPMKFIVPPGRTTASTCRGRCVR